MNRRAFLTAILGAPVVAALVPFGLDVAPTEVAPTHLFAHAYHAVLAEAFKAWQTEVERLGATIDFNDREIPLGELLPNGARVAHVCSVDLGNRVNLSDRRSALDPAMHVLASEAIRRRCMRSFCSLPLPKGVEYAGRMGPLRMTVQHSLNGIIARFDVAGA